MEISESLLCFCLAGHDAGEGSGEPKLVHKEMFPTAVTAAAYLPDGLVVIALRSTNYLHLFDPKQLKVGLCTCLPLTAFCDHHAIASRRKKTCYSCLSIVCETRQKGDLKRSAYIVSGENEVAHLMHVSK